MNLMRLLNEIEILYRSQAQFGVPVKMTVAALIVDYLRAFDIVEPPIPEWESYTWPQSRSDWRN